MRITSKFTFISVGGGLAAVLAVMFVVTRGTGALQQHFGEFTSEIVLLADQGPVTGSELLNLSTRFSTAMDRRIAEFHTWIIVVSLLVLTLCGAFLSYVAHTVISPLRKAIDFSNSLAKGDFSYGLKAKSKDEIGDLVRSLNQMRNRLEYSITKLRASREREECARREAESASVIKSDLMACLARELRNPLNSIVGIGNLILDRGAKEGLSQDLEHQMKMIMSGADALGDLVSRMMELSELDSHKTGRLSIAPFDPARLVREVIAEKGGESARKSISLGSHFSSNIPKTMNTDFRLLLNIISKLVDNAIKNSPIQGEVAIGCETETGNKVVFSVRDSCADAHGPSLADLYERHFVISSEPDVTAGFHGLVLLNLIIARHHAMMIGAKIEVAAQDGCQSVFRVVVEVGDGGRDKSSMIQTASNLDMAELYRDADSKRRPAQRQSGAPVNILLGEDNETNRSLIEMLFRGKNIHLECVDNGASCLEALDRNKFDILLLDLQMPRVDGREVLRKIRMNSRFDNLPIVILSAYLGGGDDRASLMADGADYCMEKPIKNDELMSVVERYTSPDGVEGRGWTDAAPAGHPGAPGDVVNT